MIKVRFIAVLTSLFVALCCHADNAPGASAIQGNWINESASGVFTQLEVAENGRFVFRQIHAKNLGRDYICGNLADRGDELVLNVGAMKERSAGGDISELVGQTTLKLDVVRRSEHQLVLKYKRSTVVLQLI
ncbi:MAG: hypothetical protein AB8G16_11155 [Gammaproteobacteria bacterium]